ncbi:hypothetical protein AY600_20060 [Phormidium willei BDU 130791]|nr:hypothetical protein AY600_20060 [Phormidium willei BDU 130791]
MLQPRAIPTRQVPHGGDLRADILLVDDDLELWEELRDLLSGWGYSVADRRTPRSLRGEAGEVDCRLALIDVFMPECDGIEVLRALRAGNPKLPVVLMSGRGRLEWPMDFLQRLPALGARGLLLKPFSETELAATVARFALPPKPRAVRRG